MVHLRQSDHLDIIKRLHGLLHRYRMRHWDRRRWFGRVRHRESLAGSTRSNVKVPALASSWLTRMMRFGCGQQRSIDRGLADGSLAFARMILTWPSSVS